MTSPLQKYLDIQTEIMRNRRAGVPETDPDMRVLVQWLEDARRRATENGIAGILKQAEDLYEEYEAHLEDLGRGY